MQDIWVNEALPRPIAHEYRPVGTWNMIGDLYTYVAGPPTARKAIVLIHDALGPSYQILQGGDRLAAHLNVLVLVPDFFKGCGPDHEDLVRDRNGQAALREHMACHGDYNRNTMATLRFVNDARVLYRGITSWGVLGLSWGSKVAVLASIAGNSPFKVSAQAHPADIDLNDASAIRIPHLCLASGDEPREIMSAYARILSDRGVGDVEVFEGTGHGWMGARSNLDDSASSREYERGYSRAAQFFARYL